MRFKQYKMQFPKPPLLKRIGEALTKFISGGARPIMVIWLIAFSLTAALTIYTKNTRHEEMYQYALALVEEVKYRDVLRLREFQELKERYYQLINFTSMDPNEVAGYDLRDSRIGGIGGN